MKPSNVIKFPTRTGYWQIIENERDWQETVGCTEETPTEFPLAVMFVDSDTCVTCPLSVGVALCELVVEEFTGWVSDRNLH